MTLSKVALSLSSFRLITSLLKSASVPAGPMDMPMPVLSTDVSHRFEITFLQSLLIWCLYLAECWCGAVLASGSSAVDESQCNVNCAGDATQKCGGGKRLSLYFAKELESSEPCGKIYTKSITISLSLNSENHY